MLYLKVDLKMYYFFMLGLLLMGVTAQAEEGGSHGHGEEKGHIHGTHKECPLPTSSNDIIECALSFHPSVKRGALRVNSYSKLEDKASQIPNPTLSSRYVKGDQGGQDVSELEANLSFTLELGGKRGSRSEYAKAKKSEAAASNLVTKADVKVATILNMHRLRQVLKEKELLEEALSAFNKVIGELKKLPRLSAEQEASLILFEMALEETRIDKSELFEEERKIEHFFHIATGHSVEEILRFLPKSPKNWPIIVEKEKLTSPSLNKLKSLAKLAESEVEIQKAKAWPNLKIGPSVAIEKDGGVDNKMIGFNIQMPIPLFQVNGGAKAYARSELLRAEKNIELTFAEEDHERFEQQKVYESSVNILRKTMGRELIERKNDRIEKLYLRGVVSSAVFLESLKQKLSYLRSRNHRELTATRALWNIHIFDGKIFKESL